MNWFDIDQLHILAAIKKAWEERLTTVFPRQGHYAVNPKIIAANPPADVTIERIGKLVDYDLPALLGMNKANVNLGFRLEMRGACSWFAPRTINGLHPVLRSRHEPSTVCILFFVRVTNHQRFASCSWFVPQTINGLRPVLGSRHEPSTVCVLFLVRAANHQRMASLLSARLDRGWNKPSPFAE